MVSLAVAPAVEKCFCLRIPKLSLDEGQVFLRRRAIGFVADYGAGTRECAEHQAVPRGEDLVVEMRTDAFRTDFRHLLLGGVEQWLIRGGHAGIDDAQYI